MKIFFVASTFIENFEVAKQLYKTIEELGHQHTEDYVAAMDLVAHREAGEEYWINLYDKCIANLARADVCVFEVSTRSTGLGQLIQEAVRREKPVLLLSDNKTAKRELISGVAVREKRVQLFDYSKDDDVKSILAYGLSIAKELLDIRFTMLLSPTYVKYLDEINETKGISRSEYLRTLLRNDMEKNEKHKQ